MLKKITAVVACTALIIGGFSLPGLGSSLKNTCTYVCCAHDGPGWSN